MCGIAGFAGTGDMEDLRRMNATLVHRGPDDEGVWADERLGVYLGHRRLSILDMVGGHQPMCTEDEQLVVVFNGEIYNHEELRRELTALGHRFRSDHSDTEVLLHGYRAWGEHLTSRLNGMWAFVMFDRIKQRLFASRDRFGKKPLYYALRNGTFVFGSELSAVIRHPSINTRVSTTAVKKYFAYGYIPAPHSIYDEVRKLPGGHSLVYDLPTQTAAVRKYWEFVLEPFDTVPANPEKVWGDALLDLLSAAVKRRLMSDVPLGFFLSGGIDSSSVVALACRHMDRERIQTFSIGFEESTFDESRFSSEVAELLGTRHHIDRLSLGKAVALLPEVVSRLDEPMGDSSLLPTFLLCRHARSQVTVALGGDGADELFAGYDPFLALRAAQLYDKLVPRPLHQAIRLLVSRLPVSHANMSLDFKLKRTLRGLSYAPPLWCPTWMGPLEPSEISDLLGEPTGPEELYSEAIEAWDACSQSDIVDKVLQFYTRLYLQDDILVKVDRASMMHSLEVRAPYLDIELVDFVRRVPHKFKLRGGQTKYLLKKALERILPRSVLHRAKKGFGVPIGEWLKKGMVTVETQTMDDGMRRFVESRLQRHRRDKSDERAFLWNHWLLQTFLHKNRSPSKTLKGAANRSPAVLTRRA